MTRSTVVAGSCALIAIVTMVTVHRTNAQDGPRPIPANLTNYLVPFRQLYDLEKSFPRWALPAAESAYASFDGPRIKQDVDAITAISRSSRDSGAQYWGRISGSPADAATRKWVSDRFRQLGATDIREQAFLLRRRSGGRRSGVSAASGVMATRTFSAARFPSRIVRERRPAASSSTSPTSGSGAPPTLPAATSAAKPFWCSARPRPESAIIRPSGSAPSSERRPKAPQPCWSCSGCPVT